MGGRENWLPINGQLGVLLVLRSLTYNSFFWYQILFYIKLLAVLIDFSFNQWYPQANSYFKFDSPQLRVCHPE